MNGSAPTPHFSRCRVCEDASSRPAERPAGEDVPLCGGSLDLYLVRHASAYNRDAARWPDDSLRPLTPRGRKRFEAAARGARRLLATPDVVLSSPFVRAWSTAEILARDARWPAPRACDALAEHDILAVLAVLAEHRDAQAVALVGHEPDLSMFAGHLLRVASASAAAIAFRKGTVAHLRLEPGPDAHAGERRATLVALLQPAALRRLAGDGT
jgi:phosphohistidine phosphatase